MSNRVIRGLRCPACGGAVEMTEGRRLVKCGSCQQSLLVKGQTGTQRFYVPNELNAEQAKELVSGWWRGWDKARDLRKEGEFTEAFLAWLPFWRVRAKVVGWVFGEEKRTSGSGKNRRTYYVRVEKEVLFEGDQNQPACETQEFGVQSVCLEGDELRPLDLEKMEEEGVVFQALIPQDGAVDASKVAFGLQARASAGVDRVSFQRIDLLNCEVSQVYYPLWVVRYKYKERIYQCVVDGEGKKLVYGRAPGNDLYRAAALVLSSAAGNFMLTGMLFMPRTSSSSDDGDGFIGVLLVAACLIAWGFYKFRYGGEVILGGATSPTKMGSIGKIQGLLSSGSLRLGS